jgi:hypothetical protein
MQPKTRCVSPPLGVRRNDAPGGDFERCKQRRGAVPLVIGGSGRSRRVHSAASNRLVPTPIRESKASHQHKERSPWHAGNVEAHHIDRFRSKFSVVALATGFTDQIDVVLTQKAPNIIETPRTSGANYIRRDAQVGGYPSLPQNLKSVTQ